MANTSKCLVGLFYATFVDTHRKGFEYLCINTSCSHESWAEEVGQIMRVGTSILHAVPIKDVLYI